MLNITIDPYCPLMSTQWFAKSKTGKDYSIIGLTIETDSGSRIGVKEEKVDVYFPETMRGRAKRICVDGLRCLEAVFERMGTPFGQATYFLLLKPCKEPYSSFKLPGPSLPATPR